MIKLVELLGELFKTKQPIKAKKIGDDTTTTVYEVNLDEIGVYLGNQKNFGEVFKKKPNVFCIYIKNQDRRGKKIFEAKALAEKINKFLEDKEIPFNLDDTHDSWVFSIDKKYINFEGGVSEIKNVGNKLEFYKKNLINYVTNSEWTQKIQKHRTIEKIKNTQDEKSLWRIAADLIGYEDEVDRVLQTGK